MFAGIVTIRNLKHEQKCFRNYAEKIRRKELKKKGKEDDEQEFTFAEDETEDQRQDRINEEERFEDELVEETDFDFEDFTPM